MNPEREEQGECLVSEGGEDEAGSMDCVKGDVNMLGGDGSDACQSVEKEG